MFKEGKHHSFPDAANFKLGSNPSFFCSITLNIVPLARNKFDLSMSKQRAQRIKTALPIYGQDGKMVGF